MFIKQRNIISIYVFKTNKSPNVYHCAGSLNDINPLIYLYDIFSHFGKAYFKSGLENEQNIIWKYLQLEILASFKMDGCWLLFCKHVIYSMFLSNKFHSKMEYLSVILIIKTIWIAKEEFYIEKEEFFSKSVTLGNPRKLLFQTNNNAIYFLMLFCNFAQPTF